MIEVVSKDKCYGCMACYNKCPKNAITMKKDKNGFLYPIINKEKCINCTLCKMVCLEINNMGTHNNQKAYACINKDDKIRLMSSSGGIFNIFAKWILNQGGAVFGAGFDEKFNVRHMCIEDKEELYKLRMSKYVQSDIGDTYKQAEKLIKQGKKVLFAGTPCQTYGLITYLQKDYDNLYLQDIICHGVPSPMLWDKYKEYRKLKDGKEPKSIEFRNKDEGWKDFNLKFSYENGEYKGNQNTDIYLQTFLRNYILRETCYNCKFKGNNRAADVTLADFWGIDNICPEMNDNKGVSIVIINTNKGKEIFDYISENMIYKQVELEEALKYNLCYYKSVQKPSNREKIIDNINKIPINKLYKKYVNNRSILKRIWRKLKNGRGN